MKLRHPALLKTASWLGTVVARGLVRSLRLEYKSLEQPVVMPPQSEPEPRMLYMLWHETLLVPLTHYACPMVSTLVSNHADGQLLANFVQNLGLSAIRGSTNRGGMQAVREIIRDVSGCRHLAITPDGPRGPRRVVQPGAVYLAAKTGMLLAPLGVGLRSCWRAKSWDRFAVPKPWTRAKVVSGKVFEIPKKVRTEDLEHYAALAQAELDRVTLIAEHWAETNDLKQALARSETLTTAATA